MENIKLSIKSQTTNFYKVESGIMVYITDKVLYII